MRGRSSLTLSERVPRRDHHPSAASGFSAIADIESPLVFTVEQRDALRERLLRLAEDDERVVAGAAVGSLAVDAGDRFSDLDLTFSIGDAVPVADVLEDWTRTLVDGLEAVHLADLEPSPRASEPLCWRSISPSTPTTALGSTACL